MKSNHLTISHAYEQQRVQKLRRIRKLGFWSNLSSKLKLFLVSVEAIVIIIEEPRGISGLTKATPSFLIRKSPIFYETLQL